MALIGVGVVVGIAFVLIGFKVLDWWANYLKLEDKD
jgi:hypothetical protein